MGRQTNSYRRRKQTNSTQLTDLNSVCVRMYVCLYLSLYIYTTEKETKPGKKGQGNKKNTVRSSRDDERGEKGKKAEVREAYTNFLPTSDLNLSSCIFVS